jgi:hypothetical protein
VKNLRRTSQKAAKKMPLPIYNNDARVTGATLVRRSLVNGAADPKKNAAARI